MMLFNVGDRVRIAAMPHTFFSHFNGKCGTVIEIIPGFLEDSVVIHLDDGSEMTISEADLLEE